MARLTASGIIRSEVDTNAKNEVTAIKADAVVAETKVVEVTARPKVGPVDLINENSNKP